MVEPTLPTRTCPVCSKPVGPGTLRHSERSELYHVYCRSRQLQLGALEAIDRAQAAQARAARLLQDTARQREAAIAIRRSLRADACPVSRQPATVAAWRLFSGRLVVRIEPRDRAT